MKQYKKDILLHVNLRYLAGDINSSDDALKEAFRLYDIELKQIIDDMLKFDVSCDDKDCIKCRTLETQLYKIKKKMGLE